MATLYQHEFTAADTTKWTDAAVAFDKVFGTTSILAAIAAISGNKGLCAATANESIYRSAYADALRDFKVKATLKWDNAAGASRTGGLGVRVSTDGTSGYFVLLNSGAGATTLQIMRRLGGSFFPITAATAVGVLSASLNAGVVLMLRVQNKDDGVHLQASVDGVLYLDVTDAYIAGISIEDGGRVALYHGATCQTVDISFDDLIALDFADEATSGTGWQTGIGLVINGVYYAENEWRDKGLDPVVARVSYAPVASGQILDLNDPGSPFLRVGDWVKILYNETALCEGQVQTARQSWPPPGGIVYDLVSPRQLGDQTVIEDPATGAPFVSFNFASDSEFYNPDFSGMTVGAVFRYIYDNLTQGDGGLRDVKSAPASEAAYVHAEVVLLDAIIPNLSISGNVLQAEETLLAFMPEYAIYIDPATRIRHFHKRSTAAIEDIRTSEGHRIPEIIRDTSKNYTRIAIFGTAPDAQDETFKLSDASLIPFWAPQVETTWTPQKAKTKKNTFTVLTSGIESALDPDNPNFLFITVDPLTSPMDAHEWDGTLIVFNTGPAAGSTYTVRTNNGSGKIWLAALVWAPAPPVPTNTGELTGSEDPAFKRNGHEAAFREFDLGGKNIKGGCGTANVTNFDGTKTKTIKVKVQKFKIDNGDGTTRDGVRLDKPAIALINHLPSTLCEGDGGAVSADEVELTLPVFDPAVKSVPRLIVPASGFRGTAYSFDATRWDGGGQPMIGDPSCKRTLPLNFPDFQSLALQGAEYTKMADAMLAVLGTLALSGTFMLNEGIIPVWGGLNKRLRFIDDGDDGTDSKVTGYESSNDLWMIQTEFNLRDETTSLIIGTLSAQGVDLDAYRKRFAEKTRLDALRRYRKLAEELRDCLNRSFEGGGAVGDDGAGTVSGCDVMSDVGGVSVSERLGQTLGALGGCDNTPFASACAAFPCETVGALDGGGAYIPGSGGTAAARAGTGANALNAAGQTDDLAGTICALVTQVSKLTSFAMCVAGSHDQELFKAATDLANIRIGVQAVVDCVNNHDAFLCNRINAVNDRLSCLITWITSIMLPTYDACFKSKSGPPDGVGCLPSDPACPTAACIAPADCLWTFTETVCESPCTCTFS